MDIKYNQFLEWYEPCEVDDVDDFFYGIESESIGTIVTITNSYPVYRKLQDDMKNGIYLDVSFIQHKNLVNLSLVKFTNGIDISLIEFIKGLYQDGKKRKLLKEYFKYIQVLNYNNFEFIFARRGASLVFLNYIPLNQNITSDDFIPYMKDVKHNHCITLNNNKTYRVTNTYYAFYNYANINGLLKNYGVNLHLYLNFRNTVKNENFKQFEFIMQDECILQEQYKNNHFEYFVLDNIIIINRYDSGNWNYRD